MHRSLLIMIVGAMTLMGCGSVVAQKNSAVRVKNAIQKIGVHGDITVVRSDDQWFYGSVEQIDDTSFTIYEIEQKTRINFTYEQVGKVFKGYGDGSAMHRDRNGHRIPPSRHHLGWIIAGAGLVTLLVVAAVGLRD
ncbi:MAG TPA: hypothetical protein VL501_03165 [Pyrinomonadaceae bacterium]|nr:hypothetical protein [Pyrinomonadaceae bacterium]